MNMMASILRSTPRAKTDLPPIPGESTGHSPVPIAAWQVGAKANTAPKPRFMPKSLTTAEIRKRDECENIIRKGWDTFLEVGHALVVIRDQRLYCDCYRTFEE